MKVFGVNGPVGSITTLAIVLSLGPLIGVGQHGPAVAASEGTPVGEPCAGVVGWVRGHYQPPVIWARTRPWANS